MTWAIVSNRNCRYNSIFPSYRNQSNDLQCKSIKWFLHDGNILWFWCLYFLQWVYKSRVFLFDRETVVRRCFARNVFLEVSQNSQENICARVSFFNKVAGFGTGVLLWIYEISKNTFFTEHLRVTTSALTHFRLNFTFLYPLTTSENLWFSDVFRGYIDGTLAWNGSSFLTFSGH